MDERILDYGPVPTNQKRWFRRTVRFILLLGIVAGVWFLGPSAWRWAQFLYWQNRCLNYTQPATQVVFQSSQGHDSFQLCVPKERFAISGGGDEHPFGTGIFVHAMRRPDGTRCLVELNIDPPWEVHMLFPIYVMRYISWTVSPIATLAQQGDVNFPRITHAHNWKFFAGQLDPMNPSHFTFDYEMNGQRHTCDAWLDNAGRLLVSQRP